MDHPVVSDSQPLLPDADTPLLSVSDPDEPDDDALAVDIVTLPDPELELEPLTTHTEPPEPPELA